MEFTTCYCPHPQCTHYGRRGKPRHDLLYASSDLRRLDFTRQKAVLLTGRLRLKIVSCNTRCSVFETEICSMTSTSHPLDFGWANSRPYVPVQKAIIAEQETAIEPDASVPEAGGAPRHLED
jgi:hypothetical protein